MDLSSEHPPSESRSLRCPLDYQNSICASNEGAPAQADPCYSRPDQALAQQRRSSKQSCIWQPLRDENHKHLRQYPGAQTTRNMKGSMARLPWSVENVKVCIETTISLLEREQRWDESSDCYLLTTCLSEMGRLAETHPEIKKALPHVQEMHELMLNPDAVARGAAAKCGTFALAEFL